MVLSPKKRIWAKKLSYAVKGARHGYYLLTHFNSDTASANMISGEIKLIPEIIRHRLVIKQNYKQPHTSPMAPGVKEDQEEKITTNSETETKKEKEHDNGKVDIQELDRKIDELLLEDI